MDFRDDVGVGDVRPGHSHEVDQPVADRVTRGRDVVDAGGVHHRDLQGRLHLAGELEMGCHRGAHRGDHTRERLVTGHVALDDADEVDALGHEELGDLDAFVVLKAALDVLVERHADADGEVRAGGFPNGANHSQREPQSVLDAAHPVGVVATVGQRGPERVEKVGVGLDLDAVEPGFAASRGRVGIGLDDAIQIPLLGNFRKGAVRGFADRRGGDDRQPVAVVVARAAAEMGDLAHDSRAVFVHAVGEFAQPGHDLVFVEVQVAEGCGAVGRHDGGSAHHRQTDSAFGLLFVIEAVAPLRHPVLGVGGLVRRAHDAVAQRHLLQREGLQEGIDQLRHRIPAF